MLKINIAPYVQIRYKVKECLLFWSNEQPIINNVLAVEFSFFRSMPQAPINPSRSMPPTSLGKGYVSLSSNPLFEATILMINNCMAWNNIRGKRIIPIVGMLPNMILENTVP